MSKIVLTRNFKEKTDAKYCAAEFGTPAADAIEIEGIELENAVVTHTGTSDETQDYESFGCGVILIGEGQLPNPTVPNPNDVKTTGKIKWNGFEFLLADSGAEFTGCKRLLATAKGMTVLE